jgi:hypothetical protein
MATMSFVATASFVVVMIGIFYLPRLAEQA